MKKSLQKIRCIIGLPMTNADGEVVPSCRDQTPPLSKRPHKAHSTLQAATHLTLNFVNIHSPSLPFIYLGLFRKFRFRMAKQLHIRHADLQSSLVPADVKWPPLVTAVSTMRRARGKEKMTGKSRKIDCIAARQNLDLTGTF